MFWNDEIKNMNQSRRNTILIIVLAISVAAISITFTIQTAREVEQIRQELKALPLDKLEVEKTRSEVLSARVEGQLTRVLWNNLFGGLGTVFTALAAVIAAWAGFHRYLDTRDKERLDRAASDLSSALKHLASDKSRERAVGIAGLQHFLMPDKEEYHLRALSALLTVARSETDTEVMRGIHIAVEEAVQTIPSSILKRVSWQGVRLGNVALPGADLSGIDFRDAWLEDSDLQGSNLQGARLVAARLNGANLDHSDLRGADLWYADLAGTSLRSAKLEGANLRDVKVVDLNLEGAELKGVIFNRETFPWEKTANWRKAIHDPETIIELIERFGPAPQGPKVLMLMWEIPPLVAGGTWTASYHMIRNLRQQGADVEVVVPWDRTLVQEQPFGREVEVTYLGIQAPLISASPYSGQSGGRQPGSPYSSTNFDPGAWSPYARTRIGPSGSGFYSPYGRQTSEPTTYSPYGAPGTYPYYSAYGRSMPARREQAGSRSTGVLRLIEQFTKRFVSFTKDTPYTLIHAHDWVTFSAASTAAERDNRPWIAHFHSTEADRRPADPDPIIMRIEEQGAHDSTAIIVPSQFTSSRLEEFASTTHSKRSVIPNSFSLHSVRAEETGRFETSRVVYLGRLAEQKGVDRITSIAQKLHEMLPQVEFWIYGGGEIHPEMRLPYIQFQGRLAWNERGKAFGGATAILMPSRSEPFGMVVLEAMLHQVPVFYPQVSGAAEVLQSGIQINPADSAGTADALYHLLMDREKWENTVREQLAEIESYPLRHYERKVIQVWNALAATEA
jgi:glycosyltransferase involved in cell wall biosynthesis